MRGPDDDVVQIDRGDPSDDVVQIDRGDPIDDDDQTDIDDQNNHDAEEETHVDGGKETCAGEEAENEDVEVMDVADERVIRADDENEREELPSHLYVEHQNDHE